MAVDSVIRDATAPYRVGRGLLGLVAVAAVLFATMALVAANGRAAWRGLALGLAGGIGALWCGTGLLTADSGLAVSPLALGLGLVAGLVGVIDLVALRQTCGDEACRGGLCRAPQPAGEAGPRREAMANWPRGYDLSSHICKLCRNRAALLQ